MASQDSVTPVRETTTSFSSGELLVGSVKWFNNKAGYGFITVSEEGTERHGSDIFVHHSFINVKNPQYKYLVQGEHVEFSVIPTNGGEHKFQAANVCGIKNGKLMCETRFEIKQERSKRESLSPSPSPSPSDFVKRRKSASEAPKVRGEGPRNEWTQVRRSRPKPSGDLMESLK